MLILLGVAGVGISVALVLFALRQNVNFFFTPTEISAGSAPINQSIRAGGMVREGSVSRVDGTLDVSFAVTDFAADVTVTYTGILPDLFREGDGVVVIGQLNDAGVIEADTVLAKHDESYMPPEVAHALEQAEKAAQSY